MTEPSGSRRTFLVAGAATAAVAGPLAVAAVTSEKARPVWTPPAPGGTASSEVRRWENYLGARYRIAGEAGSGIATLAAIVSQPVDPGRPAKLARAVPFMVYFEMDARIAPAGQKIYRMVRADGRSFDYFLGRGQDRKGKAVLYALFN